MAWDIEFTDEFGEWFRNLDDAEKVSVTASVDLLEELGPALGRPHVDTLKGLPVPNMRSVVVLWPKIETSAWVPALLSVT